MEFSDRERGILERYAEKCRMAGGPRLGFVLRKQAIAAADHAVPPAALDEALASLVEKELLQGSEDGSFFFLTEAGVETLARL